MALVDLLNLVNKVTVTKTISSNDGMGGFSVTTFSTVISLCAIWQNGSSNKFAADKYAKDSSHTLAMEYGAYNFGIISSLSSIQTMIETVSYNGEIYKCIGFQNNYLELNEIVTQQLERVS